MGVRLAIDREVGLLRGSEEDTLTAIAVVQRAVVASSLTLFMKHQSKKLLFLTRKNATAISLISQPGGPSKLSYVCLKVRE